MNTQKPNTWTSNGVRISASAQHKDLFIVSHSHGVQWHSIASTHDIMLKKYPPDKTRLGKSKIVKALQELKQVVRINQLNDIIEKYGKTKN